MTGMQTDEQAGFMVRRTFLRAAAAVVGAVAVAPTAAFAAPQDQPAPPPPGGAGPATPPTTVAGAIALINCYLEIWSEHPIRAEHQASGALKILRSFLRSIADENPRYASGETGETDGPATIVKLLNCLLEVAKR